MAVLRVLSDKGKEKFIDYITKARSGSSEPPPVTQLGHFPWSDEFKPKIEVEDTSFSTRTELGRYLVDLFQKAGGNPEELVGNLGMWSWLALFWFDKLCPPGDGGARKVRETARYVCSSDWRDYYRHLVASSWMIYDLHKECCRLFLQCPLYIHNDFMEQLASHQNVISNGSLIEAVDTLYWDPKPSGPKRNATNRKVAGNVRRLLAVIHQLEPTYDLQRMTADHILRLLPSEFNCWTDSPATGGKR